MDTKRIRRGLEYMRVVLTWRYLTHGEIYHLVDGRKLKEVNGGMFDHPSEMEDYAYFEASEVLPTYFTGSGYPNPERPRGVLHPCNQVVPLDKIVSIGPFIRARFLWRRSERRSAWHNYNNQKRRGAEAEMLNEQFNAKSAG